MNYKSLTVVVFIILLFSALVLWILKTPGGNNSLLKNYQPSNSGSLMLPVNPNQAGVISTRLVYTFRGKVTETKGNKDNLTFKLDTAGKDAPEFATNPRTLILLSKNGKTSPASSSDISLGQEIVLTESYDIQTKNWELQVATIIQ